MNLFRVSLIGTGGGYGESVVVQLGMNNWMVVDSCIDPVTKESLPLEYLKSLGVHIETEVKLIVCSHWHNDHILGIDKLLEECKSATLAFAVTSDKAKFLEFIGLDSRNDKLLSHTSSTDIMAKCLNIVNQRKIPVKTIKDMLNIFIKNVTHLYITSFDILNKPKKRDNSLQKAIRAFNPTLKEIPFRKGIIENYIDLDVEKCTWKTNLHGKAFEIDNEFISKI